ncbi:MAG: hypothetical protein M1828_005976 [Chrysothrix sp. TS-e1954]|nr:MAG: hypothetical protein M1828_005976 [Chrysothrix sp. TS-e1954]
MSTIGAVENIGLEDSIGNEDHAGAEDSTNDEDTSSTKGYISAEEDTTSAKITAVVENVPQVRQLDELPREILDHVFHRVTSKRDLLAACTVSKRLHEVVLPVLYESLTLPIDCDVREYHTCMIFPGPLENLKLVRHLSFVHPKINRGRCQHIVELREDSPEDEGMDDESDGKTPLDTSLQIEHALAPIVGALEPDRLQSFSWKVGMCLPSTVFGGGGSLDLQHSRIRHLCVVTDKACYTDDEPDPAILMHQKLKCLSLGGMQSKDLIPSIAKCTQAMVRFLENLTIDLSFWHTSETMLNRVLRRNPAQIVKLLLHMHKNLIATWFSNLEKLRLAFTSLQGLAPDLISAINFNKLRSLTLWNCADSLQLVQELASKRELLRLQKFELVADIVTLPEKIGDRFEDLIKDFLCSFKGLNSIGIDLLTNTPMPTSKIAKGLLNHEDSLEELVLHNRSAISLSGLHRFFDVNLCWSRELQRLSCLSNVDLLGLCNSPAFLIRALPGLPSQLSCRILHVRRSTACRDVVKPTVAETLLGQLPVGTLHDLPPSRDPSGEQEEDDVAFVLSPGMDVDQATAAWLLGPARPAGTKNSAPVKCSNSEGAITAELKALAHWAFSDDGPPNLRLLAYGDFSQQGLWADRSVVLCRRDSEDMRTGLDTNFRRVEEDDHILECFFQDNIDFLSACPVNNITMG